MILSFASQVDAKAARLARLAGSALVAEAELTPKPGLVDRRGSGAHRDLTLEKMRLSAQAIEPYFQSMAWAGSPGELSQLGRDAERAMLAATGGANAHKGAIWTLGLLVSAAALNDSSHPCEIADLASSIAAEIVAASRPAIVSHGDIVAHKYGLRGARGEALAGFPHVLQAGLPMLRARRLAGCREEVCRLDALFAIMARLDDTCVLYRGGMTALRAVRHGAEKILAAGGSATARGRTQMQQLDETARWLHVSPGGSADLLAATIFLDAIERGLDNLAEDRDATA